MSIARNVVAIAPVVANAASVAKESAWLIFYRNTPMKGETTAPERTIVLATLAPRDRKSVGYTSWLYVNTIEKAPLAHARDIVRANVNGAIGRPSFSTSKDRPRKMAQLIKLMLKDVL